MTPLRAALLAASAVLAASAARAQDAADPHAGHDMGAMQGMEDMDHSAHQPPAPDPAPIDHSAHSAHAGHSMPAESADEVGNAPAPSIPAANAADAFWNAERMARARADLAREGSFSGNALIADRLEYRATKGRDGYAWQVMGWVGGDIDRFSFETEGDGSFGQGLETAEMRGGWRHALDPWWNLELGARQDFNAGPDRTYAVVGIEGLAPYWFEIGAHAFISNKGDVHFRLEAEHDMRLTQRLILQPSIEIDAAAQDVPELGIGAGFEKIELGARLRHEFTREFAPYVGVHWERKLGETARLARANGDGISSLSAVLGIRAWF